MKPLMEIKQLSVAYHTKTGNVQAVRNASFALNSGQVIAILGESGSGKTALCKSLIGILPKNGFVAQGDVYYKGAWLDIASDKVMAQMHGREIAMVFQDPMTALNPTISIGKQIREAVMLHQKVPKREADSKVLALLEQVGIDQPEKRYRLYPHQLSGGMKQRCVIAIALACEPSLMIADEPTTALDVTIQKQILDLLKAVQAQTGFGLMLITHDLGVAAYMADTVAVMYAGEIVEFGTVQEVFTAPKHDYTRGLMTCYKKVGQ